MSQLVVDTSALVAIFKIEASEPELSHTLNSASFVVVPASCLVEAALLRQIARGFLGWVQELLQRDNFELGAITAPVAQLATAAAQKYGKRSGHPAQLNFGDCLSYGLAEYRDLPLLYTGSDFAQTPIKSALVATRN